MVKLLFTIIWFGFGAFGIYSLAKPYLPNLTQPGLIKGIQGELIKIETNPNQATQVIGKAVSREVTKTLSAASEEITKFPAKQMRKIKIGACENLLEEDICSVAKEVKCQ